MATSDVPSEPPRCQCRVSPIRIVSPMGNRLASRAGPGRGARKLLPRHVERRDLTAEYADGLDRHGDRPAPPPEPRAVRDDQLNLAGRRTHHLPHVAERRLTVVIDRQADQIADFDGLRKPPRHALLGRFVGVRCGACNKHECQQRGAQSVVGHGRLSHHGDHRSLHETVKPTRANRTRNLWPGRLHAGKRTRSLGIAISGIDNAARESGGLECREPAINRCAR